MFLLFGHQPNGIGCVSLTQYEMVKAIVITAYSIKCNYDMSARTVNITITTWLSFLCKW